MKTLLAAALPYSTGESNRTNQQMLMESVRAKVVTAIFGTGTQRTGRAIAIFV